MPGTLHYGLLALLPAVAMVVETMLVSPARAATGCAASGRSMWSARCHSPSAGVDAGSRDSASRKSRVGSPGSQVKTRDVWTLEGGASFSRSGGTNNTSLWVEDTNFLGTGKEVSLSRIGTVDRTSNLVRYRDPNLLGSRVRLTLSHADNSDGGRERFELERPFYSLSSRWAADDLVWEDPDEAREFWEGSFTRWALHAEPGLELFRERQAVDWAVSVSFPSYFSLPADMKDAGQDLDEEVPIKDWNEYVRESQNSLRVLAEQTGGIAVVNQNDFDKALKRIDAETSDYYILGYSVANPDTTRRTRQIDVQVRRPGIQVWSRSWYRTKGQPTSPPKQ